MFRSAFGKALLICPIGASFFASGGYRLAHGQNTFPASGNVGIGTTTPASALDVNGSLHVSGDDSLNATIQGAYLEWNLWVAGETDFINNQGWGTGGFAFLNTQPTGTPATTLMFLNGNGNLGLGTRTPASKLEVNGDIRLSQGTNGGLIFSDGSVLRSAPSSAISFNSSAGTAVVPGIINVQGSTSPSIQAQGAYIGWNALTGGTGETDFINAQGGGPGGFAFMKANPANGSLNTFAFIDGSGDMGLGTTSPGAKLEVNGNLKFTAGSGASMTFPDGTVQATAWNGTTLGGDYAESVDVQGERATYEPGDVIVIDDLSPGSFSKTQTPYSTLVAGVYSTKPGLVGRRTTVQRPNKDAEVPMAMTGIVPTKVTTENGPIKPGDILVSSSTAGFAMKGTDRDRLTGAIIGKALAPLKSGSGVIEVLLALQ